MALACAGPSATPDAAGDVELPGADVLAAAVYTDGMMVDFRVQLAAPPFPDGVSYDMTFCIEAGLGGDGSCGRLASDIDTYLTLDGTGTAGSFTSGTPEIDPCAHVPAAEFPGTAEFRWILSISHGGSGGVNEWVPEMGKLDVIWVDAMLPFAGTPAC